MYLHDDDGLYYELDEDEYEVDEAAGGFWLLGDDEDEFCEFEADFDDGDLEE